MKNNILILGGDRRQLYLAKKLEGKNYNIEIYGFGETTNKFKVSKSLKEGFENNDIVILPMPVTRNNIVLNTPLNDFCITLKEVYENIKEKHYIFGGMLNQEFFDITDKIFDYFVSEEFLLKNAFLTAEATLEIIISSTPYSIFSSDVLILGYGRIGKILSEFLKNLGANVTACMRKEVDFALCDIKGIKTLDYSSLSNDINEFRIIINTVPELVIDEKIVEKISDDVFLIDVSSKKGGCDFEALNKRKIRYIHALGLPGKYSPETSGDIISDVIIKQIERD